MRAAAISLTVFGVLVAALLILRLTDDTPAVLLAIVVGLVTSALVLAAWIAAAREGRR